MVTSLLRRHAAIVSATALILISVSIDHPAASAPPAIDEGGIRASINGNYVRLALSIKHGSEPALTSLSVELLDSDDSIMARVNKEVSLRRGETPLSIDVIWPQLSKASDLESRRGLLLWTRVRYRLSTTGEGETGGVRALGLMIPHLFALRVALPRPCGLRCGCGRAGADRVGIGAGTTRFFRLLRYAL